MKSGSLHINQPVYKGGCSGKDSDGNLEYVQILSLVW